MTDLLTALRATTEITREATLTESAVLQAVSAQMQRLGLRGGVNLLDESGSRLIVRAVAFPGRALPALERPTGLKTLGFAFLPAHVEAYRQALQTRKSTTAAATPPACCGRADPARGAHPGRGRRLWRHHRRAPLQKGAQPGGGRGRTAPLRGGPF
ncbi:MAG: hypothetical protein HY784_04255 [Chloroflexi bacterium]|nr:hypothetical protein [Chloroflexota bacterium]